MPKELTDRAVKALKPKDKPYEVMDALIRGFGVRVMPSGQKSFVLVKRFPGSNNPARRTLGSYRAPNAHNGDLSLEKAREKAGEWNRMVKQGLDPAVEAARQQEEKLRAEEEKLKAERLQKENTFGNAFEIYVRDRLAKQRTGGEVERTMRKDLASWMHLPLASISQADVKTAIRAFKDKPAKAHAVFTALRTFCNWIVDSGDFNLGASPCNGIKHTVLIGERSSRNRVLKEFELAAYWRASEVLGYPFGEFCQLLALTALRRDEAANAAWSEFDLDTRLWVIPAERMKGKEGKAKPHAIPLTNDIVTLLEGLPRFVGGSFLFSTNPVGGGQSVASARLRSALTHS